MNNKITFLCDGEEEEYYVLDSTRLAGRSFLLVTNAEGGDGECYIMEDMSAPTDPESSYEMVEDEELLDHLASIFGEQSDDFDIEF